MRLAFRLGPILAQGLAKNSLQAATSSRIGDQEQNFDIDISEGESLFGLDSNTDFAIRAPTPCSALVSFHAICTRGIEL